MTEALGTLRTAEMEAACDRIDLRMYWHSERPDDTIFDFGFSKSGVETLGKWGRARTLARFVEILRTERPDIMCPTFLDVPGQHGHHRAMTEAAFEAMDLAADPGFAGCDLPAWQVKKLYLPAYSGAGQAYDDDLPPPPATLTVIASDHDPVTGHSYARIGQQSRARHATQAMGRWVPEGGERDYPLHLAKSVLDGPDECLSAGLPATLADLGLPGLVEVQRHMDDAIAAFPNAPKVLQAASAALEKLRHICSFAGDTAIAPYAHKLRRKRQQLSIVIRLAAGVQAFARVGQDILRQGELADFEYETRAGDASITVAPLFPAGWQDKGGKIGPTDSASLSDPYPSVYLPGEPPRPCLNVAVMAHGVTSQTAIPFETTPLVVPTHSATVTPASDVLNTQCARRSLSVRVADVGVAGATVGLDVPGGWHAQRTDTGFDVTAPKDVAPGLYELALTLDGHPAHSIQQIAYPHIATRVLTRPAVVAVRVVDVALPGTKVGYIGSGHDKVAHWLDRLGADVTDLSDAELGDDVLAQFDCLVIGIFAIKFRAGLTQAMVRLHAWAHAGGTLITLYHRPWDNWDPDATAPHRLEIGQPSLRWRVTDEAAEVAVLAPDHQLLHQPNSIGADDWEHWHKERGLYFAKSWDDAYTPLIAMHDPDEAALQGAWLVADVGQGRHIHTSLILHHQMEKLVPGAFRIMANLLAKRG